MPEEHRKCRTDHAHKGKKLDEITGPGAAFSPNEKSINYFVPLNTRQNFVSPLRPQTTPPVTVATTITALVVNKVLEMRTG